ncbi:MAG: hypothetical protein AB8H47_15985 [Bacteroidia bacterium]
MDDTLSRIESYLAAEMSETERIGFAERLAKEPELQAQLTQYQDSRALLEQAVSLRLKKQMQQMQRPEAKVQSLASPWLKWGSLAASIVVLLAAGLWWTGRSASSYNDYFEPYALASSLRGDESKTPMWQEAYERQDYPLANRLLNGIPPSVSNWVEAQFFLGNIALIEARPTEAVAYFKNVIKLKSPRFETAAEWYLVLAYWGKEDLNSARQLAAEILEDEQHPYYDRVKRLIPKLE